ncbi:MAG: DUF2306 domain-containing protein [Acidobacteria bacterium]|nr:DUF2306 domain-containing protein [Acidobacteriota bacterium]
MDSGSTDPAGRAEIGLVRFPGWLKAGFGICIVIAVAAVVRRMVALSTVGKSSAPLEMGKLDAWFRSHAVLTWVHISAALVFVLLLPFVFQVGDGKQHGLLRVFFVLGTITGATAYGMSRYAVGGWIERSAVLVFDTLFLLSLARAYTSQRSGDVPGQRMWMVRSVAILLGIATTRPVKGVFFATQRISHLTPDRFFGIAFWIGFSINTVAIELWLRSAGRRIAASEYAHDRR